MRRLFTKHIECPKCGETVSIPCLWIMGIEVVFRCKECGRHFKTGYKMGALLNGLALAAALVTANIGAYILSSATIPLMALTVIPLWVGYGFLARKWWLLRKK